MPEINSLLLTRRSAAFSLRGPTYSQWPTGDPDERWQIYLGRDLDWCLGSPTPPLFAVYPAWSCHTKDF
jgi:hypothetical protein